MYAEKPFSSIFLISLLAVAKTLLTLTFIISFIFEKLTNDLKAEL